MRRIGFLIGIFLAILGLVRAEKPCPDGMDCEKSLDRLGGHWPKYGSSALKRKIRKLEYQLEQEKMKNSAPTAKSPENPEELKNAKMQIEELEKKLENERGKCAELQKSLDHAKAKIKNFLSNMKNPDSDTKYEKMSKNLQLAQMQMMKMKKLVRFMQLKQSHMKFQIVSKIIHAFVQQAFSVLKDQMNEPFIPGLVGKMNDGPKIIKMYG